MIKVATEKSRFEKVLRKIEDLLREEDVKIIVENHGLVFRFGGKEGARFRLMSTDSGTEPSSGLPRELDDERLVLDED